MRDNLILDSHGSKMYVIILHMCKVLTHCLSRLTCWCISATWGQLDRSLIDNKATSFVKEDG